MHSPDHRCGRRIHAICPLGGLDEGAGSKSRQMEESGLESGALWGGGGGGGLGGEGFNRLRTALHTMNLSR